MYSLFNDSKVVKDADGNEILLKRLDFVCDSADDVSNIDKGNLMIGSMVYVISEKKLYILDSTGEWNATA